MEGEIKETIDNQRNFYDIDSLDYFQTNNFGDVNQQYSDMFKHLRYQQTSYNYPRVYRTSEKL